MREFEIKILQIRGHKNRIHLPKGLGTCPTEDQTPDGFKTKAPLVVIGCKNQSLSTAHRHLSALILQRLTQELILFELHKSLNIHQYFSIQIQVNIILLRTNVFKK